MSDIAIRVDNLGKQYHIGAIQQAGARHTYKSLRDSIANAASVPFRAARAMLGLGGHLQNDYDRTIWALRDVSFEVHRGEIIGVIGRNGAGKSTLLKILSRITEPTAGRAEIHGRTGSLLEVGTGFHPELTGRDNIYLNGSILGMRRAEIARQFDAIVAFAEVEEFVDTPVKHYSSGMYLRLAFAVAAHLETEILLVDEVLAVGDLQFQEKCLGKIQDVAATGRTVLFVSHSISSVQRLCTRALLFAGGKLTVDSSPAAVIAEYIGSHPEGIYTSPPSTTRPTITNAALALQGEALQLSVEFQSPFPISNPVLSFVVYNSLGAAVFGTDSCADPVSPPPPTSKAGRFEVAIPSGNFRPDRYLVSLWLSDQHADYCTLEMILQINLTGGAGGGLSPQFFGNVYLPTHWRFESIDAKSTT
jgi:lipopolysaccharide transport system ATP-binding protein